MATLPTANINAAPTHAMHLGDHIRQDPRIAQAKALIAAAVADHTSKMNRPTPPIEALLPSQTTMLDRLAKTRGAPTLWPYLSSGAGNGPFVELIDGSVKLDFIGGIGVHGGGHAWPAQIDAAVDAAIEDTVMQGNLQQHPPSVKMAEHLIALATAGGAAVDRCLISTSGAMANENALKIALHAKTPANRILAFDQAFAGRTLALASLTDRAKYRQGLPLTLDVDYLPFRDPHHPQRSQRWAVDELRRLLDRHGDRYAAFWAEPIAGEGGYYAGSHEFFRALCEPLRQANIPIIFDEVQAFGRTSRPFAFSHYRLDEFADIVTVGKITQACATLWRESLHPTAPILSQTFTGSSASIACGLAILKGMEASGCFGDDGENMKRHAYFADKLASLAQRFPGQVKGPWGEGMMIAFTPGDGSFETAKKLVDDLYAAGLLAFLCGGNPTRVRFLPPPIVTTTAHIDMAIDILADVLSHTNNK